MPFLQIEVASKRREFNTQTLLQSVTQAVQASIGAALPSIRATLSLVDPDLTIDGGTIGRETALVRISLLSGRSEELKAALLKAVTAAVAENTDVPADSVRVVLGDILNYDLGLVDGVSAKALGR
ncbi:MAG: tautomerase family protein [Corticimicrobacter sp.]|uniref:tautomerase family protein n=1 Tax=Corticimicrobacter sp. TaxID=2678536 RepID=UPI0032DA87BD